MAGPTLIFKWKGSGLKSRRSVIEKELKEEGWGSSLTEEQIDKCDYLERKLSRGGEDRSIFVRQEYINKVK